MIKQYLYSIDLAKFQYLLAFNMRGNITCGKYLDQAYHQFTYGNFTLKRKDLKLTKKTTTYCCRCTRAFNNIHVSGSN